MTLAGDGAVLEAAGAAAGAEAGGVPCGTVPNAKQVPEIKNAHAAANCRRRLFFVIAAELSTAIS